MITSILSQALTNSEFRNNTVIVNLNGFVHTDDAAALKSITRQMRLEMAVDGKVFATFADNLAFLLDCLKTGNRSKSKSVIYILEEFDLFCSHANQTLIYNLFDVAQSAQAPICVIGLTGRYDVMELLEKRVKSRFSHRQVFLIDEMNELGMLSSVFVNLLKLPKLEEMTNADYVERQTHSKQSPLPLLQTDFDLTEYAFERNFINKWNKEVNGLSSNKTFKATIGALFELNVKLAKVKNIMFRVVANIDGLDADRSAISTAKLAALIQRIIEEIHNPCDSKLEIMCDLSILEFSLLIAMKHHSDIYDHEPFNFEIILTRLHKFQNAGDVSVVNYKRDVVLKAFDVLKVCPRIATRMHPLIVTFLLCFDIVSAL